MSEELKNIIRVALTTAEQDMLNDYITNLEEKVNQYENPDDMTLFYMWLDTKAKDKFKELQQEIQKKEAMYDSLAVDYRLSQEENERLNNIINNDFSKICREKMIDKLSANEMILLQNKEIERLNNIINELEKYCNEEIEDYDKAINSKILSEIGRDKYEAEKMCFTDMLDKLQELKDSDK